MLSQKEERDEMLRTILEEDKEERSRRSWKRLSSSNGKPSLRSTKTKRMASLRGTIEDLSIPDTGKGGFHPFFLKPQKNP